MVRRARFSNQAITTLNGEVLSYDTTITVTDGSVFPSEGDYFIAVGSEIMKVVARSTNDLTVVRGSDNTGGAGGGRHHDTGKYVYLIVTKSNMDDRFSDTGLLLPYLDTPNRIQDSNGAFLTSSDFTWVNQDTSTAIDETWGGITISAAPDASADEMRILVRDQDSPSQVDAHIQFGAGFNEGSGASYAGILFRQSGNSRCDVLLARPNNVISHVQYTDAGTVNSVVASIPFYNRNECWLRLVDNTTNLIFSASFDGVNWFQVSSQALATWTTPDQVGFFTVNAETSGNDRHGHLLAWYETASVSTYSASALITRGLAFPSELLFTAGLSTG